MKLTFIGATHEVTGSCHLLEVNDKHILVDCGMEQGPDLYENQEIPVPSSQIDYVFLTHAHIDHSGLLPLLYKEGFRGQIYTTFATHDLCDIMLRDSAHIQEFEAEWRNRKAKRSGKPLFEPLYNMQDAMGVMEHFVPCNYGVELAISSDIHARFNDVGHLLGSASIEIWLTEDEVTRKIVFSGDVGNEMHPILRDPKPVASADYVVIESTYGDRLHGTIVPDYVKEFSNVLNETFRKGGNVVIPSFAVGRTQEILYIMREIKEKNLVPDFPNFPVYVDSPLAIEATTIFHMNMRDCFAGEALELVESGVNPLVFPGLKTTITSDESKLINFDETPKVILSASGMCEAGRIRHHLKHNLWREESTILFVGYQAQGTLGRSLIEGAKRVRIFGESIEVKARIQSVKGISGHADMNGLLKWLGGFIDKPRHVFVVHGDDTVTDAFADKVTETFGVPAFAPYSGGEVDLITGRVITEGTPVPIRKTVKASARRAKNAFDRVVAAARRLLDVVLKNEGLCNKDLAKFESQINNLADKWDRDD